MTDMLDVSKAENNKSGNIKAVGYDAATQMLYVDFGGGKGPYRYLEVPIETYNRLIAAESLGKFFHAEIKGKFEFEKPQAPAEG